MANVCKLVWGDYEVDLLGAPYAPESDGVITLPEPDVVAVMPDFGPTVIARLRPSDVQFSMPLKIAHSTAAGILNALATLKVLVDGHNQVAARPDEERVYLALDRDGGGGTMLFPVQYGLVDDGSSHFRFRTATNVVTPHVNLRLRLENAGQAETTITLKNMLLNGDFSLSSGGLGTSWTASGAPTTTIDTTNYLINGQAQKITAGAANLGIHSEDFAGVTSVAAYAWVYVTAGSAVVAIRDTSGPSDLANKTIDATDSGGVSDASVVDRDGKTWYRVPVTWSGSSSTIDMQIRSYASGAATASIDGCYLQTGTTTVPAAWSSYHDIDNRGDRSTSNPSYVNYLDIWGVPGDMPAFLKFKSDSGEGVGFSAAEAGRTYLSKQADNAYLVANMRHWVESDEGTYDAITGGTGVWSDGAGTTDNHYKRFTEGATANGGYVDFHASSTSGQSVNAFWAVPRRVFALCRCSASTVEISAGLAQLYGATRDTFNYNEARTVTATSTWELIDLGILNGVNALPPGDGNTTMTLVPTINVTGLANGNTFDLDAMLFLYGVDDGLMLWDTVPNATQIDAIVSDGQYQAAWVIGNASDIGNIRAVPLGACWYVEPGARVTRLVWAVSRTDNEFAYANNMAVTLTVTPRARLLLGSSRV